MKALDIINKVKDLVGVELQEEVKLAQAKYTQKKYLELGIPPPAKNAKEELGIEIPYDTSNWCNIVDEDWYNKSTIDNISKAATEAFGWKQVRTPKEFDVITMSIGSTNITNHCALYIGANRILQTMVNRVSWTTVYGRYYKNYTIGIFRWIGMLN